MKIEYPQIVEARAQGRPALDEHSGKQLLASVGINVPASRVIGVDESIEAALQALKFPLAVKIMSPDILHKSDAGGVRINLHNAAEVEAAIDTMRAVAGRASARIGGFLIEEMAPPGQEIVIGALDDPQFGPLLMVGLGGVLVEVLADVAFRICPIDRRDAEEMLAELKGARILAGVRGEAPVSRAAIVDALLKIGGVDGLMMRTAGQFKEVDVNPLIVSAHGACAVDARFILADRDGPTHDSAGDLLFGNMRRDGPPEASPDAALLRQFEPLFTPSTVAVVGASTKGNALPNVFVRRIRELGFTGDIYLIHPSADEIDGLPTYRTLADTPRPVDYAYIAVSAAQIPAMLRVAAGRVRFAQVISSGFGEVDEGRALQEKLTAAARDGGMRLIGPNCLGIYTPRGRIAFTENSSRELGTVGVVSQSGGLGTDIVRRGAQRGLKFSGLVTVGNCADVVPSDLLQFFIADPATRVIGLYIETARDGRRLFETLRKKRAGKPVVILKGGRTRHGLAAAASHTGSLAGDARAWDALSRQTGCVLVDTLDQFIEALLMFQTIAPSASRVTQRVALFGNGGGTSVLATDYFARLGLDVEPFDATACDALAALKLPPGTSITNPVDCPVITLQQDDGRVAETILALISAHGRPDAIVMHLNLAAFVGRTGPEVLDNLIDAALRVRTRFPGQAHFVLVLRSDGDAEVEARKREFRAKATALGIPVYDEMSNAGHALAALQTVERFMHTRGLAATAL